MRPIPRASFSPRKQACSPEKDPSLLYVLSYIYSVLWYYNQVWYTYDGSQLLFLCSTSYTSHNCLNYSICIIQLQVSLLSLGWWAGKRKLWYLSSIHLLVCVFCWWTHRHSYGAYPSLSLSIRCCLHGCTSLYLHLLPYRPHVVSLVLSLCINGL